MDKKSNTALKELIDGLQEDLSREYQAIIAYTVYSNVLTGAQWMNIAKELKKHAHEELEHALIIADQIDYLGEMPNAKAKEVKLSDKAGRHASFRSRQRDGDDQGLSPARPAGRGGGAFRSGGANSQDHRPGAGTSARPGDGAGDRGAACLRSGA